MSATGHECRSHPWDKLGDFQEIVIRAPDPDDGQWYLWFAKPLVDTVDLYVVSVN